MASVLVSKNEPNREKSDHVTTSNSIWVEVRTKCLDDVVSTCLDFDVPDELIINKDQTPSKYVATDGVTMATKGSKHVSQKGSNDKRAITAIYSETLAGDILPLQLIYQGKTRRSLPSATFPDGFLLSMNKKHWSNEEETVKHSIC